MANFHSFFLYLLFSFVLFLSNRLEKAEAYEYEEKLEKLYHHMHVIAISSLTPAKVCSTPTEDNRTLSRLQVAYKYGPCSPLKGGNPTAPSLREILLQDKARVKHLLSKTTNQNPVSNSGVELTVYTGYGDFLVPIGFGTPKQTFKVIFDTGSGLTWVNCHPQQDRYFNPFSSSTYSHIPCGSASCNQLESTIGHSEPCTTHCIYLVPYADGSSSKGYWSTDTLTLSSFAVFPNFEFGCGYKQVGYFGSANGLISLGRNAISAVSQTAQQYGKKFSYCLPSTSSSTGYLAFGNQVAAPSKQYISLLTYPMFYFVNLTGISVIGTMLNIPSSVFQNARTIIDSGTVITRLPPTAYSALSLAFKRYMTNYPTAPPQSKLDTCYHLTGYTKVRVPPIGLHFVGRTRLIVDGSGALIEANPNIYCLAFIGYEADADLSVIGNTQQKRYEVMYDVTGGRLGFTRKSCE